MEKQYNQRIYPELGLEANYYRNPSNFREGTWCYYGKDQWERCCMAMCEKPTTTTTKVTTRTELAMTTAKAVES